MRLTDRLAIVALASALVAACTGAPGPAPSGNATAQPTPIRTPGQIPTPSDSVADVAKSNIAREVADPSVAVDAANAANALGIDLFTQLRAGAGTDNLVFSPTSVAIALAMARAGARGETAAQMDHVLHSLGSDDQASAINALDAALNSRSGTFTDSEGTTHDLTLSVANAPFAQRDEQWQPEFLDALAQRFGAGLRLVDYRTDAEGARVHINSWVSDQTNGRIPELIGDGMLDELTRLVLVNAIYLKAPWAEPFGQSRTIDAPFTKIDGAVVTVPTMHRAGHISYAEGAGWQAVEIPYIGDKLAMTIILPDDFDRFATQFDAAMLDRISPSTTDSEIDLTLPRFAAKTAADLSQPLQQLGMPLAFDSDNADFSGMTTEEQLFIAFVIHQANISVDEKGTEAAAATAVGVSAASMPSQIVDMHVDRPFIFALRDVETGAVLFMGQILDPASTS